MNILITGTAGYIGGAIADQYALREDVDIVYCIDKDPQPAWLQTHDNIVWIQANLATDDWRDQLPADAGIAVVVHCAWQIRDWYGGRTTVREWNIEGSRQMFDYVFTTDSVERMVYFSSIAQYGAVAANCVTERFDEQSNTRMTGYCYADDKYEVDQLLQDMYAQYAVSKPVMVIKPSTVTGPRGRVGVGKFSLAAALSADANKTAIPRPVQWLLSFMPVIGNWTRQFVHEDDIVAVVSCGAFDTNRPAGIDWFIVSPNDVIDGKTMAEITGKKALRVPGVLARIGFWVLWHGTRGRIPTAPGVWRFMAYPICVDGSKVTRELGHKYQYTSRQAIGELSGHYAVNNSD